MKAVIPSAVKKESMFPFSEETPTGLLPVMGKPLTRHLVDSLREIGADEIFIVVNHQASEFEEEYSEDDVTIIVQEELNGTAGALEACGKIEEDFLVVNGDVTVSTDDLESLKRKFVNTDSKASVLAAGDDKPEKFGVLSITNDQVDDLEEKPEDPNNVLVNSGIYMFDPEIFELISEMNESEKSITDAVKEFIEDEEMTFEIISDYWLDIGTPRKLLKADEVKREHEILETDISEEAEVHEKASIIGNAIIEDGAEVLPGTVIEGEVLIGEDCIVGPNTHLKNCSISNNCYIRPEAVIDSIVFEDTVLDSGVTLEASILGEETDVHAGTVLKESFIGARSFIEMNNSIKGVKFVPDARTDLSEISK